MRCVSSRDARAARRSPEQVDAAAGRRGPDGRLPDGGVADGLHDEIPPPAAASPRLELAGVEHRGGAQPAARGRDARATGRPRDVHARQREDARPDEPHRAGAEHEGALAGAARGAVAALEHAGEVLGQRGRARIDAVRHRVEVRRDDARRHHEQLGEESR